MSKEMKEYYIGFGPCKNDKVEVEDAFDFAMETINKDKKEMESFKKEFGYQIEEWFFSGNYVKERLHDEI